jgi:hypothetical protein
MTLCSTIKADGTAVRAKRLVTASGASPTIPIWTTSAGVERHVGASAQGGGGHRRNSKA